MGTQDSFGEAQEFRETYGTESFTMLWDPGFDSWSALGIRGQPQALLFPPVGAVIGQWFGPFDPDEVLDLSRRALQSPEALPSDVERFGS
ncbi:MAG: hypothetical protein HKO87_05315 [Acidimicrobiia bacterium]|nr:hypothetical protein [Acidimicrobiia bacterium]